MAAMIFSSAPARPQGSPKMARPSQICRGSRAKRTGSREDLQEKHGKTHHLMGKSRENLGNIYRFSLRPIQKDLRYGGPPIHKGFTKNGPIVFVSKDQNMIVIMNIMIYDDSSIPSGNETWLAGKSPTLFYDFPGDKPPQIILLLSIDSIISSIFIEPYKYLLISIHFPSFSTISL